MREIATERFPYPNDEAPSYRTHVNLPEPELGEGESLYMARLVLMVEAADGPAK